MSSTFSSPLFLNDWSKQWSVVMLRLVRNFVLPCVALTGVANTAVAADLMVVKSPVVPFFSWAGFYVGAHAGYIWDDPELVATANAYLNRSEVRPGTGPGTPAQAVAVTSVSPPGSLNDTSGHRFNGGGQTSRVVSWEPVAHPLEV